MTRPQVPPGAKSDAVPWCSRRTTDAGIPRRGWSGSRPARSARAPRRTPCRASPTRSCAGVDVSLRAYYIDALPYPNEAGAIATTNVSRDEADQMCASKGKRLCTELEWERACKGAANTTYEYGDDYEGSNCGTGVTIEEAARRPTGDRLVQERLRRREMHGGAWEWTSSAWGRGHRENLGVLRGGNALAGRARRSLRERARQRRSPRKSPTMGFRCCKGEPNTASVELPLQTGRALEPQLKPNGPRIGRAARAIPGVALPDTGNFFITSAWTWRPVPNESVVLASGCAAYERNVKPVGCALFAFRPDADPSGDVVLAGVPADVGIGEMVIAGDSRHVRVRGLMSQGGLYARESPTCTDASLSVTATTSSRVASERRGDADGDRAVGGVVEE